MPRQPTLHTQPTPHNGNLTANVSASRNMIAKMEVGLLSWRLFEFLYA